MDLIFITKTEHKLGQKRVVQCRLGFTISKYSCSCNVGKTE